MRFRNVLTAEPPTLITEALSRAGELSAFIGEFFKRVWRPPYEWKELFNQMDEAGTKSFVLTSVTRRGYRGGARYAEPRHLGTLWRRGRLAEYARALGL